MITVMQLLFIIIVLPVSKSNFVHYEVTAFNPRERAILYNLQSKVSSLIFLNGVSNEAAIPMDVIVNKKIFHMFEGSMRYYDIEFKNLSEIKLEQLSYTVTKEANISNHFYNWDEILKWIDTKINKKFKKIVVAKTYERRDIFFLKLKLNRNNPTVFIVGGEEGMDWLSSAVILNLMNDLLENADELKMLIANFNFYFMPILNPDGFDYSMKQERFWSKNRRKIETETKCEDKSEPIGVNVGRNWFFEKASKKVGEQCNAVYIGHRPISEEETQALSYVLNNLALSMIAFVNVRGFGRYITVPYADASSEINNHNIVMDILRATCFKVRRQNNITFYVGATSKYFYNFSGNMADWVKKKLNIPLVYTVYLEDIFSVIPNANNIKTISKQFYTILNQSLIVTKDIYGPLFNCATKEEIIFLLYHTFLLYSVIFINAYLIFF